MSHELLNEPKKKQIVKRRNTSLMSLLNSRAELDYLIEQ